MSKPFDMELFLAGVLSGSQRDAATPFAAGRAYPNFDCRTLAA